MTKRRLLTVAEYAAATGTPEQTVRDQLRSGRLSGKKYGGRWRVNASQVRTNN